MSSSVTTARLKGWVGGADGHVAVLDDADGQDHPGFDGLSYNASILPANIAGGSADAGGSGVATVQVAIQDGSGNYWGGATFNQASIFYNATGGTVAAWTYSTGTLVGQLTDGHTYTISARSTDTAGNTGTTTRTSCTTAARRRSTM